MQFVYYIIDLLTKAVSGVYYLIEFLIDIPILVVDVLNALPYQLSTVIVSLFVLSVVLIIAKNTIANL